MQPKKSMSKPSKNESLESTSLPDQVIDVLKKTSIGYLSVLSKSEELYSYPVAYYYSKLTVYFVTPVSAAKYKIIKNNPRISFIVDNGKVTTEACGAMIQGRAKIFSVGRTLLSILSLGPKIEGFSKKYPGMLSFYARGKELPDERKLYKYRLIRIKPTKIVYWVGYMFGRRTSKIDESEDSLELPQDEAGLGVVSRLMQPIESTMGEFGSQIDHDWLARFDTGVAGGILSKEEGKILTTYKLGRSEKRSIEPYGRVTPEERVLLWKSESSSQN